MKKLIIEDYCHHRKQAYMLRIHSKLTYPTPVRTAKVYKQPTATLEEMRKGTLIPS